MFPLLLGGQSLQTPAGMLNARAGIMGSAMTQLAGLSSLGQGQQNQQGQPSMAPPSMSLSSPVSSPILGGQSNLMQSQPFGSSLGASNPSVTAAPSASSGSGQQWQQLVSMLLQKLGIGGAGPSMNGGFGGSGIYG
jgi:hypothetical protein